MSNNLNDMVTVSIDIDSPLTDTTSFDNLLILGPSPRNSNHTAKQVNAYHSLSAVQEAGFTTTGYFCDPVGRAARIAFSQSPAPKVIYIGIIDCEYAPSTYEELEGLTYEELEEYTYEELEGKTGPIAYNELPSEILDLALSDSWYVVCPVGLDHLLLDVVQWTESQEKMCCYTELADSPSFDTSYFRSFGIFGKTVMGQDLALSHYDNLAMNVAWVARCLSYHAGAETWNFKQLASMFPSSLTETQKQTLSNGNITYFQTSASKNLPFGSKTLSGEWIDVVRFRDWLKHDIQFRVAQLFIANAKIPYTTSGIALVQNQMIASLKSGVSWGGIAEDEYDEDGVLIPSFTTSVPSSSNITSSQKSSRKLDGCTFTARIAGAIHMTDIKGSLTYDY